MQIPPFVAQNSLADRDFDSNFACSRRKNFIGLRNGSNSGMVTSALLLHSPCPYAHDAHKGQNGPGAAAIKKSEDAPMELNTRAAAKSPRPRAHLECAQCGNSLFLPEW